MSPVTRRSSSMLLIAAGLLLAAPIALVGCDQQEGERCERAEDCGSDLICHGTAPNKVCRPPGYQEPAAPVTPLPDAGTGSDLALAETAAEASSPDSPAADQAPEASSEVMPDAAVDSVAPTADVRLDSTG